MKVWYEHVRGSARVYLVGYNARARTRRFVHSDLRVYDVSSPCGTSLLGCENQDTPSRRIYAEGSMTKGFSESTMREITITDQVSLSAAYSAGLPDGRSLLCSPLRLCSSPKKLSFEAV